MTTPAPKQSRKPTTDLTPSPMARVLAVHFEGLRLHSYKDAGGRWTIGYGHTRSTLEGMRINVQTANRLLELDIEHAWNSIKAVLKTPLFQQEADALTDFVFNVGASAFASSTLHRRLAHADYAGAWPELLRWDHVNGSVVPGLLARRQAEYELATNGKWPVAHTTGH